MVLVGEGNKGEPLVVPIASLAQQSFPLLLCEAPGTTRVKQWQAKEQGAMGAWLSAALLGNGQVATERAGQGGGVSASGQPGSPLPPLHQACHPV